MAMIITIAVVITMLVTGHMSEVNSPPVVPPKMRSQDASILKPAIHAFLQN